MGPVGFKVGFVQVTFRGNYRYFWCLFRTTVCIVLTYAAAYGQQSRRHPLPFAAGEELIYQAEFNRGLLRGIDVAEFHFKALPEQIGRGLDDATVLRLSGDVASKGFFLRLAGFHFRQHIESVADAEPFTTLRTVRSEEQGKRSRLLEAVFDHKARRATWIERKPNQQTTTVDFSEPIQDVLTAIYYLRTQNLEPGHSFVVPLSDSGRMYQVAVLVRERKELHTMLGRVKTIRIEPALFGENAPIRARGQLSIWLTEDERRLPVRAQLKHEAGTFEIKLKRVIYPRAK